MASTHALSFSNLIKTATVTASTSATAYPVANLLTPEVPYMPWRSTVITQTTIVIDQGSAKNVEKVVLINGNFRTFRIEANTADSWGAPAYTSPVSSLALDPDGIFYRRAWEIGPHTPLTWRFIRLVILAQTPIDGAVYFALGGIHLGTWVVLPRSPRPGYGRPVVLPVTRSESTSGRYPVSVQTGSPFARQRWTRHATKSPGNPGSGDEWAAWIAIDKQIRAAGGKFAHHVGHWGPAAVWMMEQQNETDWMDNGKVYAEDEWMLTELVAG